MKKLSSCTVLVTGAGGFIGSHLAEMLVGEAARVRAMVHYNSRGDWGNLEFLPPAKKKNLEVIAGDIADAGFVRRSVRGCDVVFHLAALIGIPFSYLAPEYYIQTNIEGTHRVLRAALEEGVSKVVHTSTSETYGTAQYVPIDEKHPLQGQSPYSATKIGADKIAESYHLSFGLPVATLRPFNTYGPRQSARAVIPTIITQLLEGPAVRLGSLDPVRDLTFVTDTAAAFVAVAASDKTVGEVVNAGNGKGIRIGDLLDLIARLMGRERVRVVADRGRVRPDKSEVMRLVCDNRKILDLAGWKPRVSIEEGLKRAIDHISKHRGLYKPGSYAV